MVVGEAPGEQEDETGVPFIGASGKKLDWMLGLAKIDRKDVYVTNAVKCWPGAGNRKPYAKEVKACRDYLEGEMRVVKPSIVICMGLSALSALGISGALKSLHGRPTTATFAGRQITIVPMYHPAAYLRNPNLKADVVADWTRLEERLNPSTPATVKNYRRGFAADLPITCETLAFDVETEHVTPNSNPALGVRVIGFSTATTPNSALYFSRSSEALRRVAPILEDTSIQKVCHNAKYEYVVMRQYGVEMRNFHDTKLLAHLLGYQNTELKDLTFRLLGEHAIPYRAVDWSDTAGVVEYGAGDADHTLRIFPPLLAAADGAGLTRLYEEIELPLVRILGGMELAGIPVNKERLNDLRERLEQDAARLRTRCEELAPSIRNIASPKQLGDYLYGAEGLNLPVLRRTAKTQAPATDEAALEDHKEHPFVKALLEYRAVEKFRATYVMRMLNDADVDGWVHPQWKQVGEVNEDTGKADWSPITGRLSSSPNFQNVPAREETAKPLRACIQAPEGYAWASFDFSQLELRILGHYLLELGDDSLARVFIEGRDPHAEMGFLVHNTQELTPTVRADGKKGNFAIVYGAQVAKLMESFPWLTREAAAALRDAIYARYPGLPTFMHDMVAQAQTGGAVYTIYGRRRLMPKVWSANRQLRAEGEREAINMPIQGTAADVVKIAMQRVDALYPGLMRAQIHDDLKLLAPVGILDKMIPRVVEAMERDYELRVPLRVDVKYGESWADEVKWHAD